MTRTSDQPTNPIKIFPVRIPPDFRPVGTTAFREQFECQGYRPPYRPRFGGGFDAPRGGHTHGAVDIMAAEGAPIVAPFNGRFPSAIRMTLDGRAGTHPSIGHGTKAGNYFVLTSLDGHFSFYGSHLLAAPERFRGEEVGVGDVIGYVGRTGNASYVSGGQRHGCPHLHCALWLNTAEAIRTANAFGLTHRRRRADIVPLLRRVYDDATFGWSGPVGAANLRR